MPKKAFVIEQDYKLIAWLCYDHISTVPAVYHLLRNIHLKCSFQPPMQCRCPRKHLSLSRTTTSTSVPTSTAVKVSVRRVCWTTTSSITTYRVKPLPLPHRRRKGESLLVCWIYFSFDLCWHKQGNTLIGVMRNM